jgi:cytidyltransferase-like protein
MPGKKVFVTGCFDLLHSGHIAFFEEASRYGDLYVGIGSDRNIFQLKGRKTVYPENERLYMIKSLRFVKDAWINGGMGVLDFLEEINELKPDIFFVNEDGHFLQKENLCRQLNIQYIISRRIPVEGLPQRSTTDLRQFNRIPYRIDLAGGWLDQPFVGKLYPGPVLTISIEPTIEFNDRSGMASSTRRKAIELWQDHIPQGDDIQLARTLFCYENPPGTKVISGSQDALGIVLPGLNRLDYEGDYWPSAITRITDESILAWIEEHLCLIPLNPRGPAFNVLEDTRINHADTRQLSMAAVDCWESILRQDLEGFGKNMTLSYEAQVRMFPKMTNTEIEEIIRIYSDRVGGWKLSGAGGGGYLIFVTGKPLEKAIHISIKRKD